MKKLIKSLFLSSGYLGHKFRNLMFPGVAVLCYHGIRDDSWPVGTMNFEQLHVRANELEGHCRIARELCNPISLNDWRAAINGGPTLPKRPVLFTFDDGYRSIFTLAKPILEKYGIPAVFFLCYGPIEKRSVHWFDAAAKTYGEKEVERVKRISYNEWKGFCDKLDMRINDDDPHALLKKDEIRSLAGSPGFEIGSHTFGHVILNNLNLEEQKHQVVRNKECLKELIEGDIKAFAYPNGKPDEDYSPETVKIVQDAGFDMAFTTCYGLAKFNEQPLECPRFLMLSDISASELAYRLLRYG